MSTVPDPPEPDHKAFDEIVSGLRSGSGRSRRVRAPSRPAPGDFGFAVACLAVIVPMSMVVGGWVGLTALFVSVFVARTQPSSDARTRQIVVWRPPTRDSGYTGGTR